MNHVCNFWLGSTGSLAAGLLFGTVLGYGAYQTSQNPDNYHLAFGEILEPFIIII